MDGLKARKQTFKIQIRKIKGIATGTGTGIGKRIEVGFKDRKKKDEINDHILLGDTCKT